MANVWLFFLAFPMLSVAVASDLTTARRVGGLSLLVVFAAVHAAGYRALVNRELGHVTVRSVAGARRFIDTQRSELWFVLLIVTLFLAGVVGGWGALGALPFIVTFAMFNFSWRTAGIAFIGSVAVSVVGPLIIGELSRWWFLIVVLCMATIPAAVGRLTEERQHDVAALQAQLMLIEERSRLARDVHDVLGHSLTAIVLKTQVIDRMLAAVDDPAPEVLAAREQLSETEAVSRRALSEIRSTVSGLRSAELGEELAAARSVLSDADIDLVVHGDPAQVPNRLHEALGWTVREAVTNIVRHADASNCSIELGRPGALLAVRDDGIGADAAREGNGLTGLRERLAEYGLALDVQTADGTALLVTVKDGAA